jgi:hypothetical protein
MTPAAVHAPHGGVLAALVVLRCRGTTGWLPYMPPLPSRGPMMARAAPRLGLALHHLGRNGGCRAVVVKAANRAERFLITTLHHIGSAPRTRHCLCEEANFKRYTLALFHRGSVS